MCKPAALSSELLRVLAILVVLAAASGCGGDQGGLAVGATSVLVPPSYSVSFRSVLKNEYMTAENGGGSTVNANRAVASTWETFKVVPLAGYNENGALVLGSESYVIIYASDGHLLCAADWWIHAGGGAYTGDPYCELFKILGVRDGYGPALHSGDQVFISTNDGHFLQAIGGGGAGVGLQPWGGSPSGWEAWYLEIH